MRKPLAGAVEAGIGGTVRRDALIVTDERGRVVEWSDAAAQVFGYAREEVVGRHLSHLFGAPGAGEHGRGEAESRHWRRRIRAALSEGRLLLAAQPVVNLRSGRVDRHELLLRMDLGNRLAKPAEFIGEAERSGQIREIDLWMVRRGIDLAASGPVAINVSARSLDSELLLAEISRGLKRTGASPEQVTIEITETAGAADLEQAAVWVGRLTELGCRVSLDDFGTGYGAFSYLNRLSVCELKIDREFVARVGNSEVDRRVVSTIVEVGRSFGMTMVAEGVEDEQTLALLADLGVDLAQGFFLGRPEIVGEAWEPRATSWAPPGPRPS